MYITFKTEFTFRSHVKLPFTCLVLPFFCYTSRIDSLIKILNGLASILSTSKSWDRKILFRNLPRYLQYESSGIEYLVTLKWEKRSQSNEIRFFLSMFLADLLASSNGRACCASVPDEILPIVPELCFFLKKKINFLCVWLYKPSLKFRLLVTRSRDRPANGGRCCDRK